MKKKSVNNISAEVLAAFLDGNATAQESKEIINALTEDAELSILMAEAGLICLEEIVSMTDEEVDQIKAAVSLPQVVERAAYARNKEDPLLLKQ